MSATETSIAVVRDIVAEIQMTGGTPEQQLNTLFEKFNVAARSIDPSITGSWIGYDAAQPKTPAFIVFERSGQRFFGRATK